MEIYWDNPPQLRSAVFRGSSTKDVEKGESQAAIGHTDVDLVKIPFELWLR